LAFFIEGLVGIKNSFITIFSEATENDKKNEIYNNLMSLAVYISLPLTVFLLVFGTDVISVFLERGLFTTSDTKLVNLALSGFCWSLLPMVLQVPMEQIFQVHGKVDLMVRRKILGLLTNVVLNSFFLFVLNWGIWGIALATSISYWLVTLYSICAAVQLKLVLVYERHVKWACWMTLGSSMAAFVVHTAGMYTDLPFKVIFQGLAYATLIFMIGLFYRGSEGQLVKEAVLKLTSLKR
jgi:peptidoglycan biosynthesis protein MviN/MurJ (putative lipid II flippase)